MHVWIVGVSNAENNTVHYVCSTKEIAVQKWDDLRIELIRSEEELIEFSERDGMVEGMLETFYRTLVNLQETDPDKMNNYPQDEPYIRQMEVL